MGKFNVKRIVRFEKAFSKQKTMKKILVPFDFSSASFNAVHHAIRIAQLTEAQITFLWSHQLPAMEDDEPGPDAASFPDESHPVLLWQRLQNMLQALCVNEKPNQVRYLFQESLEGDSLETLLQGNTYDLLVIGIEGAEEQTPFPGNHRMAQRIMDLHTPALVVTGKVPSQLIGTITLLTDSMNMREKQALTVLFDLTEAFRAHLQIIYIGRQKREAYSFRQAVKQLGLASRLDVIRHTYHFAHPYDQKELEEMAKQSSSSLLVLFKYRESTWSEVNTLQHLIAQSRVPLLLLPATEKLTRSAQPAITRERAAFADSF